MGGILIVGAGPVGLFMSNELSRYGFAGIPVSRSYR